MSAHRGNGRRQCSQVLRFSRGVSHVRSRLHAVSELQANAPAVLARLKASHVPVVVTDDGRSEAVLLDMETYAALQSRLGVLEGIARGEREIREGLGVAHEAVMARLDWWKNRK